MKIDIQSKNLDLTPALREYIEDKIGVLKRLIKTQSDESDGTSPVIAFVEVERMMKSQKHGEVFRAEINLKIKGELLRVEGKDYDMRVAIDSARDTMERRIKEFKSERRTKNRRGARSLKKLLSLSPLARFRKK